MQRKAGNSSKNKKYTTFIRTKTSEVKTATSSLSIMELEKYLNDYEEKYICIADCENQFNEAFDRYINNLIVTARSQI